MTKEELKTANEQLGAEVAALRALLTEIGGALPEWPASSDDDERFYRECRARLVTVTAVIGSVMGYAGERAFVPVLHNGAVTIHDEMAKPLPYAPQSPASLTAAGR